MSNQNRLWRLSVILFFLTLVMLVVHIETLIRFNRRDYLVTGGESDSSTSVRLEMDARADSTSTWLKRDFKMEDGRKVDLTGQTIDGTLSNQSRDMIQDWKLRINIIGDCYINQAWTGEVEIHQFVETDQEKVQRMNLQDYRLEQVKLAYVYDGDLLIPLKKGDYFIYYPSARFNEMPVEGGADVKIGVIFYYLDPLDFSDYELQFHFHRSFTQGYTFYAFGLLLALWMLSMAVNGVSMFAYRRAMKEMELRKSGIFSMSDIYDLIYVIHLSTGEMTPVSVDEKLERERPKNKTAKELLTHLVLRDTQEMYRERMLEFVDTDTLADRLRVRNSISYEFVSRQYGWCILRFFAMDRMEGKPLENVVCAVQNINEEKKEQEAILQQIEEAHSIHEAKAAFMDSMADELAHPLRDLTRLHEKILRESHDDTVVSVTKSANNIASRLLALTCALEDGFAIESGKRKPSSQAYSLRELILGTLHAVLPLAEENHLELSLDVLEALPDHLQGDIRMLQEVLVLLLYGSIPQGEGGKLQLAVYGKVVGERVHLLFSVRSFFSDRERVLRLPGLSKRAASSLLTGMGSELIFVPSPAGRSEFYFELEQRVMDNAPIGKLTAQDAEGSGKEK